MPHGFGPRKDAQRVVGAVALDQRLADPFALRGEKGVGHGAAHHDHVGALHHHLEDRELVGDFGAAEDAQEGFVRVHDAAESFEFGSQ